MTRPLLLALLLAGGNAHALEFELNTAPELIYELGGAAPVSAPLSGSTTLPIGLEVRGGIGNVCGRFDPAAAFEHSFDRIASGADRAITAVQALPGAIISNLPLYLIQRADPGAYERLMNFMLKAEETVNLAVKSCETMQRQVARGGNPFEDLIVLSRGENWSARIGVEDIVSAAEGVDENGGDEGITWVGGERRGGVGQERVRIVADTVRAGYNMLLGRRTDNSSTGDPESRLGRTWRSPAEAVAWISEVVGESGLQTSRDAQPSGRAGRGLLPVVEGESETVAERLAALVEEGGAPTPAELAAVAAPGVPVTAATLEGLRGLPPGERRLVTARLAAEIALARTIDQALMARRVVLAGRMEPHLARVESVQGYLERNVLGTLDREIESLMLEMRVRREVVSASAATLAGIRRRNDQEPIHRYRPSPRFEEGAPRIDVGGGEG